MKIGRRKLRKLIREQLEILIEGEDEGADLFGGEEDEGGEEEAEEEGAEEEGAEEGAEDEGAEEEDEAEGEKEIAVTPEEEVALGKSIDTELDAMLIGFESNALKSAEVETVVSDDMDAQAEDIVYGEWHKRSLKDLLFEGEEVIAYEGPLLDMEKFTADVARLVMNYTSLLDMEGLIINKVKDFLRQKYDEEHVDKFEELLDIRFGIEIKAAEEKAQTAPADHDAPVAVGASPGQAEAGAV